MYIKWPECETGVLPT